MQTWPSHDNHSSVNTGFMNVLDNRKQTSTYLQTWPRGSLMLYKLIFENISPDFVCFVAFTSFGFIWSRKVIGPHSHINGNMALKLYFAIKQKSIAFLTIENKYALICKYDLPIWSCRLYVHISLVSWVVEKGQGTKIRIT